MTNQEVAKSLKNIRDLYPWGEDSYKTLDYAIRTVVELPKRRKEVKRWRNKAHQMPCGDAISRQEVLDGIEELKKSPWATDKRGNGFEYLITEALDVVAELCIKQASSVNPLEAVGQDKPKNNVLEQLKNLIDEFNMQDLSFDEMSGSECKVLELLEQDYICDTCKTAGKERGMKYISEEDLRAHLINDGCDDGCGYLDERDIPSLPWIELDEDEKEKVGHWKSTIDGKPICSECDFISESLDGYFVSNYCPNCGAKMVEPQESEGV